MDRYRVGSLGVGLLAAATMMLGFSAVAGADQWNERSVLKFSTAVMVPGATLQAGTYVFQLADAKGNRHTVEISREDSGENVALVQAVPMKRQDVQGDLVVKFNPTEPGTPPALKGYFYPGSLYGHEFVYPDEQAKKIAERTRTIVLSTDVPGSDLEQGTLRIYDAAGLTKAWMPDADAVASWDAWQRSRHTTATAVTRRSAGERAKSMAPAIGSKSGGQRVGVDQLEDDPDMYIGKTVSVDAEVEDVYGPRVFTIDEPNWGDLEGEVFVFVPSTLAALVRENDRVTVTGTVERFAKSDFEGQWGWMDLDRAAEQRLQKRPVLVASRIVGGNDTSALLIEVDRTSGTYPQGGNAEHAGVTGTSGRTPLAPVSDLAMVVNGGTDMVGRQVNLDRVKVTAVGKLHGLFVMNGGRTLYVLPAAGERPGVTRGDEISVEGVVLQMPRFMKDRLMSSANTQGFNDSIYVYATSVER